MDPLRTTQARRAQSRGLKGGERTGVDGAVVAEEEAEEEGLALFLEKLAQVATRSFAQGHVTLADLRCRGMALRLWEVLCLQMVRGV